MNRKVRAGFGDASLITASAFSGLLTGVMLGFALWHFV